MSEFFGVDASILRIVSDVGVAGAGLVVFYRLFVKANDQVTCAQGERVKDMKELRPVIEGNTKAMLEASQAQIERNRVTDALAKASEANARAVEGLTNTVMTSRIEYEAKMQHLLGELERIGRRIEAR